MAQEINKVESLKSIKLLNDERRDCLINVEQEEESKTILESSSQAQIN